MPNYTWLRPRRHDDDTRIATKKRAVGRLRRLRAALDAHFDAAQPPNGVEPPRDRTRTLRLATWNLREFDSPSFGYRGDEAKAYIAEILSRFDLIALQEVRRDLGALNDLRHLLGRSWDYVATDVTEGSSGNKERMAFLFNRDKVWFTDVAGELTLPAGRKITDPFGERFQVEGGPTLTLPPGQQLSSPAGIPNVTLASGQTKITKDVEIPLPNGTRLELPDGTFVRFAKNARVNLTADDAIDISRTGTPNLPEAAEVVLPPSSLVGGSRQFARTPFVAAFQSGWLKINLATVHIYFGEGEAGLERRKAEIEHLTELLADRARSDSDSDADAYFIALGDFNIVNPEHETMKALQRNDFEVPAALRSLPGTNVKKDKHYDQIALWKGEPNRRKSYTRLALVRAGVFDFFDTVYTLEDEAIYRPFMKKPGKDEFYKRYTDWRTHQMSDHLPMWAELHVDFTDEYLDFAERELDAHGSD